MMLLRPEVLPSAVLLRAMLSLSNPPVPDLAGKRVLLSAGETDPIIPLSNVQALATLLQNAGADVHLEVQSTGHRLLVEDVTVAKHWIIS